MDLIRGLSRDGSSTGLVLVPASAPSSISACPSSRIGSGDCGGGDAADLGEVERRYASSKVSSAALCDLVFVKKPKTIATSYKRTPSPVAV